ncbi:SETDB1 [Lepeophtheirus salmonis]|uniref:SETDB1 n=1 Tax=Lepeophtheirus salmonis TaxID=72036 RepID=A0A7R8HCU7_LEPSM|nr:SETDB1 [Lepeophtheirus salmonis]CAF3013736.1 SETDB1 [Lepeophtheirus salmonis]
MSQVPIKYRYFLGREVRKNMTTELTANTGERVVVVTFFVEAVVKVVAAAAMALGGSGPTSRGSTSVVGGDDSPIIVKESFLPSACSTPPAPRPKKRIQIVWQCVNPVCIVSKPSKLNRTADSFLTSFYGAKSDPKKKRKICVKCRSFALLQRSTLEERVRSGKSALAEDIRLPVPNDVVLLDISDEDLMTDPSGDESDMEVDLGVKSEEAMSQEQRLDNLLHETLTSLGFSTQISSCLEVINQRLLKNKKEVEEIDQSYKDLETEVNNVRNELYAGFKPTLKELPPIEDIDNVSIQNGAKSPMEVARSSSSQPNLPPMGEFQYTSLESGEKIYAMRGNVLNVWREGIIVEVERKLSTNGNGIILTHSGIDITYKLRFDGGVKNRPLQTKTLTPRQVAYHKPSNVRLLVGTRVIAIYQDDSYLYKKGEFYSGVIAEPPKVMNKYRYLIFFDDGYASYVHHDNVRPVTCQTTPNVWEDVHSNSREFIKQYLSQYPERPMVKLSVDQAVWTEWDGKWCSTKVIAVDASLVKLHFKETGRLEWVYRGSTRLSPLFREMQQQKMRKEGLISVRRQNFTSGRKNTPYVEYTRQMDENSQNSSNSSSTVKRAVARKSTAPKKIDIELPPTPTIKWESEGEIFKVVLPEVIASPRKRLRNMDELHTYLSTTKSTLELDFFTYDWWVHVYNEFKTSKVLCKIEDISYGKENVPISCVNSLDNNYPEYVEYSTKRIPQSSVNLNLDDEFLEGCDCEDDCRDKSKCNCWKLTLQSSDDFVESKNTIPSMLVMLIGDCQMLFLREYMNAIQSVFKTERRGWGIRTLHDIPQGGFVCVYVGNLYDNEEANKLGQDFGDEYFAELDMIEAVERRKEGYESDCGEDDEAENKENPEAISDFSGSNDDEVSVDDDEIEHLDDERDTTVKLKNVVPDFPKTDRPMRSLRKKTKVRGDTEEITVDENEINTTADQNGNRERAVLGFDASVVETSPKPKYVSTRKYFGKNEDVYIMDAKTIGNVGRYLNHSCNPNIFVQNCFVDTHDLRYPWIAFFASSFIRAGTELCWDYCYIVDQVEGKEIYCECGASNCRGRLL